MSLTPTLWLPLLIAERKELDEKIRVCRKLVNTEDYFKQRQLIQRKRQEQRLRHREPRIKARRVHALLCWGWSYKRIAQVMKISSCSVAALGRKHRRKLDREYWKSLPQLVGETWIVIAP